MLNHVAGILSRATPPNPAPTITGISGNMYMCGQQELVITGTNFYGPITGVDINGAACTNIIHDSETQIRVTTPMASAPGPTIPVHVVCRGGTATLNGVFQWQVSPFTFESCTPDPAHEG
ncbi:MAG TPA: IPT/TIG domain-containing protein, partial [Thermoanaerobaculaceae bacterium]|nr:IPT/TIG domain-containing protein [Thermoanaerobaculaceae bacterium]